MAANTVSFANIAGMVLGEVFFAAETANRLVSAFVKVVTESLAFKTLSFRTEGFENDRFETLPVE